MIKDPSKLKLNFAQVELHEKSFYDEKIFAVLGIYKERKGSF